MGGNDREAKDEEGRECSMPPLYTNKFCVSRCFYIYFQRTGLAEYLRTRRGKSPAAALWFYPSLGLLSDAMNSPTPRESQGVSVISPKKTTRVADRAGPIL